VALAAAFALLLAACSSGGDDDESADDDSGGTETSETQPVVVNEGANIAVTDFQIGDGEPVTISVGETVTWTNESEITRHSLTHEANVDVGEATLFDSRTIGPGESFQQVFQTPGTFDYFCSIHPETMQATIIIEEAS
jgi:plastocyanin